MKDEMIQHTLNAIAELVYEDELKEAETLLEAYIKERVVDELYEISKQGGYVYPSMGLALADRVHELTGKSKLSR